MRIVICDDEVKYIDEMTQYIEEYFKTNRQVSLEIISYTTGEDLLSDCKYMDIVFLDVVMGNTNGIEVGKMIKQKNPKAIICMITSHKEYLDDAMRFQVFRYIFKPIQKQSFLRNLGEAVERYNQANIKVAVETVENKTYMIDAENIRFVEARGKNTIIYTKDDCFTTSLPMKVWKQRLCGPDFFTTHRSYLVNFRHITSFDHSTIYLDGEHQSAYLTRRNYNEFKKEYFLYLEKGMGQG